MILSYNYYNNIPIFKCNLCGKCSGIIESTSYTNIKNRGCCWYFPEYRLIDIKNIVDCGKENFIHYLSSLSNSKIENYSIRVFGTFFKDKYNKFMKSAKKSSDFNLSLFFKLCPFLGEKGCTLNFTLRPHPCNLYLCRTIIAYCGESYSFYSRERKDYYAYCNYINECLKQDLIENKVNLSTNLYKSIDIIKKSNIPKFFQRKLKPIHFSYSHN
jgi:hypothetical protein